MNTAHLIYEFSDANMAGFSWTWHFTIRRPVNGLWTLAARQTSNEPPVQKVDTSRGIKDGFALYDALEALLDEIGDPTVLEDDIQTIHTAVTAVDATLGAEFLRAHKARKQRAETSEAREEQV